MTHFARDRVFDELWAQDGAGATFDPGSVAGLPDAAQRYLTHAIAPGTPRASAVRLQMHGEIKLGKWRPFVAEEVLRWDRGFVWRARTRIAGLPVGGSDRWVDGRGAMQWKMLGLIPVMVGAGPDISRSALGRAQLEVVWLPSALLAPEVAWQPGDDGRLDATRTFHGEPGRVSLTTDAQGRLRTVAGLRWGDPDRVGHRLVPFGGHVEEERSFDGYTIPSRLRLGWFFGTDRFEPEGEFFRATISRAEFR
ncbi:MAG TPA: DUF6544 family protein [Nannocystis sp.]